MSEMITKEYCLDVLRSYFLEHKTEYHLTNMALFGSFARNEQTEDSDVDVLFEGQPDILLRIKMKEQLQELLGCSVDLVRMRKSLAGSSFTNDIRRDLIFVA